MIWFILACISKKPINLYTFEPDSKHLFVEVQLNPLESAENDNHQLSSNKGPYFFMIDTGANTSIINQRVSHGLGLELNMKEHPIIGLGGIQTYYTTKARVSFDGSEQNIEFAVGVEGLPDQIKGIPISGILGNDFFEHYTVEIDYKTHHLSLHDPNEFEWDDEQDSLSMSYNNKNILVDVVFESLQGDTFSVNGILDTGSQYILLRNSDIPSNIERMPMRKYLLGLGSNNPFWIEEAMPYKAFHFEANKSITFPIEQYAYIIPSHRKAYMPQNIIGSEIFANKKVIIDYKNERIQITPSRSSIRNIDDYDISKVMFQRIQKHPEDYNLELKLQIMVAARHLEEALQEIENEEKKGQPIDERIRNYQIQILLLSQKYENIFPIVEQMERKDFCAMPNIKPILYALIADQKHDFVKSLLRSESQTCFQDQYRIQSDVYMMMGLYEEAFEVLQKERNSSKQQILLRKAILSYMMKQDLASISYLRSAIPNDSMLHNAMFIYVDAYHESDFRDMLRTDLESFDSDTAILDIQTFGWRFLDNPEKSLHYMKLGIQKDCQQLQEAQQKNCIAWYETLANINIEEHYKVMSDVIKAHPYEASFLDTYAMILQKMGQIEEAHKTRFIALLLSPESEYMLYQYMNSFLQQNPQSND